MIDDHEPVQIHGETEKSQEEFCIGGFSFEDPQQSGVGLPGLGESESAVDTSTKLAVSAANVTTRSLAIVFGVDHSSETQRQSYVTEPSVHPSLLI